MSATQFIKNWRQRAADSTNVFDQFFYAWTALVITARQYRGDDPAAPHDTTDRTVILHYLVSRPDAVVAVLDKLPEQTKWLAQRKGTATGQPILDVHDTKRNQQTRQALDHLATCWAGKAANQRNPEGVTTCLVELLNHVRNNMFHGRKDPDDAADQELLAQVNPILLGLLAL